jgi:hypothetical protein
MEVLRSILADEQCQPSPLLRTLASIPLKLIVTTNYDRLMERALGACKTIEGYEAMHAIRKGQIRWVAKGDAIGQRQFIHTIFGLTA